MDLDEYLLRKRYRQLLGASGMTVEFRQALRGDFNLASASATHLDSEFQRSNQQPTLQTDAVSTSAQRQSQYNAGLGLTAATSSSADISSQFQRHFESLQIEEQIKAYKHLVGNSEPEDLSIVKVVTGERFCMAVHRIRSALEAALRRVNHGDLQGAERILQITFLSREVMMPQLRELVVERLASPLNVSVSLKPFKSHLSNELDALIESLIPPEHRGSFFDLVKRTTQKLWKTVTQLKSLCISVTPRAGLKLTMTSYTASPMPLFLPATETGIAFFMDTLINFARELKEARTIDDRIASLSTIGCSLVTFGFSIDKPGPFPELLETDPNGVVDNEKSPFDGMRNPQNGREFFTLVLYIILYHLGVNRSLPNIREELTGRARDAATMMLEESGLDLPSLDVMVFRRRYLSVGMLLCGDEWIYKSFDAKKRKSPGENRMHLSSLMGFIASYNIAYALQHLKSETNQTLSVRSLIVRSRKTKRVDSDDELLLPNDMDDLYGDWDTA